MSNNDNSKIIENSKAKYKYLADDKMPDSNNSGFSVQFSRDINGEQTEFVFQRFASKWFLLITQYGKLANLYTVKFDVRRDDAFVSEMQGPVDHPQFHVSVPVTMNCSFGADKDEIRSGIQFLLNKSNLNRCTTEILIGLALKDINGKILRELAKVLDEIIT